MKFYAACMSCLIAGQERKLRDFPDEDLKAEYIKELMRLVGNSDEKASAPWLASQIGKIYERYFGCAEDYAPLKKEYNWLVMNMEEELERKIRMSEEPLRTAMRYARVGNYIDFSAVEHVEKEEFFSLFEREHDEVDEQEYQQFSDELKQAKEVVYLLDNCGEIVLDKLVIRLLKEMYPQVNVTAVVRGAEVLNDATMEDAVFTGLTEETEVIGNGDDTAGTILFRISEEAKKKIESADVIVAKGQGNFESLQGCGLNIYYLFLCKCDWFMRKFQVERYHGMFVNDRRLTP